MDLGVDTHALTHGAARIDAAARRWDAVLADTVRQLQHAAGATGSTELNTALTELATQMATARRALIAGTETHARHVADAADAYVRTDTTLAGAVPEGPTS